MPDDSAALPAPGWYPHPAHPGSELYWDGAAWTDRSRPATPPMPVYGTPSPAATPDDAAEGRSAPYAAPSGAGRNPMAVASLVLGLLSIVANILLVPSILAIVFGIKGRASAATAGGGGLATAGLVTGILGIVISGLSFLTSVARLAGLAG